MRSCSYETLYEEVRSLHVAAAPKTWYIARQALEELHAVGLGSAEDLRVVLITRWLAAHENRSSMTNRKLLAAMRAICGYCSHEGYIEKSPFGFRAVGKWLRAAPALKKRHHSWADTARVLALLASEASSSWEAHRLHALTAFFALTGVRKLEALRLKVVDLDLDAGFAAIVARDRRLKTVASEAPVPLPDALVSILRAWLPRCEAEWVFPHQYRTGPWTEGPAGNKALDQIKAAGVRAGVEGFTILSLRHGFATHAESRWNLSEGVIKRVLRHTSLQTQKNYRHADLINLRRQVRAIDFGEGGFEDRPQVA